MLVVEVNNSMIRLEAQFPEVPLHLGRVREPGHGVFVMTRAELEQYRAISRFTRTKQQGASGGRGTVLPTLSSPPSARATYSAGRRGRWLPAGAPE